MYYNLHGEVTLSFDEKRVDGQFYERLEDLGIHLSEQTPTNAVVAIGHSLDEEYWEEKDGVLTATITWEGFDLFLKILDQVGSYLKNLKAEFSGNEGGDPEVEHWRYILTPDGKIKEQCGKVVYDEPDPFAFARVRLLKDVPLASNINVTGPDKILQYVAEDLSENAQECVSVLCLDSKGNILTASVVSRGTVNASLISPRDIFQIALLSNAASIILLHNHPSGDSNPSSEDCEITERMQKACEIMNVRFLDHVIVGNGNYYSFNYYGMLEERKLKELADVLTNAA